KGILKKPILYLSDFFERNRFLYYDNLMRVRTHHDLTQWFKFFLVGIIETAKKAIVTFDAILKLKQDIEAKIQTKGTRSHHLLTVMNYLYQRPIIEASKVVEITGVSGPTAYRLLDELVGVGVLKEITGGKRGKIYGFDKYISLF